MRKNDVAAIISTVTLFDLFLLVIQWIAAMPGAENAYGYYNDGYDITRFEGLKGSLFNWFSNMIEPVTEGHVSTLGEFSTVILFLVWMMASGAFAGVILSDKQYSRRCPWMFIIAQAVVSVYWATYICFVWLR